MKRVFSLVATLLIIFSFFLMAIASNSTDNTNSSTEKATTSSPSTEDTDTLQPSSSKDDSAVDSIDPIVGEKTSFKDLGVGEVGRNDGVYIGLQYVKSMNYLPTALDKEEISGENEVILGFFELYNGTKDVQNVRPEQITCYADGTQVDGVDTYITVKADGVSKLYSANLDPGCQLLTVQDFEVQKGWSELKFYYDSVCIWTVSPNDVNEDDYKLSSLFDVDNSKQTTELNESIFQGDYDVQFQGVEVHKPKNQFIEDNYAVFKFHVTNNKEAAMDTSLMGYSMRAYQNNYYLGDASFAVDEKIDGYSNIFNVDSIEAGMSSDIYVAFALIEDTGTLYMVYDDGYITNHICGYVYTSIS